MILYGLRYNSLNHNPKNGVKIIVGGQTVILYFDQSLDLNEQKQKIFSMANSGVLVESCSDRYWGMG